MAALMSNVPGRTDRIVDLAARYRGLSVEEFTRNTAAAFLIYSGKQHDVRPAREWQATASPQQVVSASGLLGTMPVYPLRPRSEPRSPSQWYLSIGRAEGNEIVLSDASISVFHAMFRRGPRWEFLINDAGSKNGTYVNGRPAPKKEGGTALEVPGGSQVRLGSLSFTFLLAPQLHQLIVTIG